MSATNGFDRDLRRAGLTQRSAARLLGREHVTGNRWCRARGDALKVPQYARLFVRAWSLLPVETRRLLAGAKGWLFPFERMEVGDSFEFRNKERWRVQTAASAYGAWRPGAKFVIYPFGDRHRIWRTA